MSDFREQLRQSRVLVVDDEVFNVELLVAILDEAGYTNVRSTTDPRQVTALHQECDFHLILLDLRMPFLDGFQVMEQLAKVTDDDYLPVLVISSLSDTETRLRALEAGAKDFVTKPFNQAEVLNRIRNMLEVRLLFDERRRRANLLEAEVNERTRELHEEIVERRNAQKELANANDRLTEALNERTDTLTQEIVERKATEKSLLLALQHAEEASRAKTEFLGNMSHELRTPLTIINASSEILNAEMFGPLGSPSYVDYAKNIHEAGEHLLQLINDLLDISQIETGRLDLGEDEVDAESTIAFCCNLIEGRAREAGLRLEVEAPGNLARFRGDDLRIRQVVLNLLSNAIKFTPKGGTITLKGTMDDEGHVVFAVADTGIGIARENQKPVLETFAQVENAYSRHHQGSGIGLPLSKRLVELHGGTMELESELGVGTTVTVRFPRERVVS